MTNLLDLFAVGFNSDGLQNFQKNLKSTSSELDKSEKKVKQLEDQLEKLRQEGKEDSDEFKKLKIQLEQAQGEVKKFGDEVKTMQGKSEFQLLKLRKNFTSLIKTLGVLATVTMTVKQSMQFYEEAEQLDFLAQKTQIAVDSLQRLGGAAKRFGGSTESTAAFVEQFQTQEFKQKVVKYGIKVIADDPEKTLENIASKMEKLQRDSEKWKLAADLGIDEGTTRLLISGVERYREELKRANKYKLYTKEDIERMRDFRQVQQDIRAGIQNIQVVVAKFLLPALTQVAKVIKAVTDWMTEHEGAVKIAVIFLGIAAAVVAVTVAVSALSAALAFLAANPIVLIIIAVIAAITLLIAIIQDLITWANGGESALKELFRSLGYDVDAMGRDLKTFFDFCVNGLTKILGFLNDLGEKFKWVADTIKSLWESIPEPLRRLIAGSYKFAGMMNPLTDPLITGHEKLNRYKINPNNAVPEGAQENYYNTVSNEKVTKLTSERYTDVVSKQASVYVQNLNLPNVNNSQEFVDTMSKKAVNGLDNGFNVK